MITNAREYAITRAQAAKLSTALETARARGPAPGVHPDLHKAEISAIESEITRLHQEVEAYEALRDGRTLRLPQADVADLPAVLIKARIANNLSQKELAARLGLHEQQVQRYEANGYRGASFDRLLEVARVLGVRVEQKATFALAAARAARTALRKLGFEQSFIDRRLLPAELDEATTDAGSAFTSLAEIGRVFGWSVDDLARGTLPELQPAMAGGARFKLPKGRDLDYLTAYSAYAYRLACGANRCAAHLPRGIIPQDAAAARKAVTHDGPITLRKLVEWAWSEGVVVIPLPDPAAFHAAFWRIEGRNIIILKQKNKSAERWMNDLLHDLYHAAIDPLAATRSVVDTEDPAADGGDAEEDAANEYARDVLLAGIADQLIEECVEQAGGSGPHLKAAVPRVARKHGVPVGALANHLAWTLDRQHPPYPMRWWGPADSLQTDNTADVAWARDLCFERLTPPGDPDPDVELLFSALRHGEVG